MKDDQIDKNCMHQNVPPDALPGSAMFVRVMGLTTVYIHIYQFLSYMCALRALLHCETLFYSY